MMLQKQTDKYDEMTGVSAVWSDSDDSNNLFLVFLLNIYKSRGRDRDAGKHDDSKNWYFNAMGLGFRVQVQGWGWGCNDFGYLQQTRHSSFNSAA